MQKEPSMRYQNATEMLEDLRLSLKKPDEDFVTLKENGAGSPTQRIPTIYEIEKNGDRKESSKDNEGKEKKKGKINKIREFYSKHKVLKVLTILLACILLFFIVMFGTIHTLNSSRPKEYEIIDLVWKDSDNRLTKEQAEELLKNSGFTNYSFEEEYSDSVEAGYVISQTPVYQPNYTYNVDQAIVVLVSKGQKMITIPKKLVGKNIDEVKKALDELEAKYEVQEINDEEVEAGIVLSINPEEGEEITASSTITIEVSKGSAYKDITVKSVIGKTESEAKSQLENDGFTSIEVEYTEDSNKSDGVVLEQSISSGKTVKENEKITLTVNKLPQEATLTFNINLKSLKNYTESVSENTTDSNTTNSASTNTTTKTTASVIIKIDEDVIFSKDVSLSETSLKKTWTTTGRKRVRVIIDGVTEYDNPIDFNKGDQTINIP
jgi:serine/threonine-protein kinase